MSSERHVQSPLMNFQRGVAAQPARSWIHLAFALLAGGVFIYAGALKIIDPLKFATDIQNFKIVPWSIGIRVAFYLPWLEIICGVAVIVGWMRAGALGILTALTVMFIGATIAAQARGIDLDCGCFGSATKNLSFGWHMAIDFALLAILLALWFWPGRRRAA